MGNRLSFASGLRESARSLTKIYKQTAALDHIVFEQFYTGDTSRHSESTGLGLFIVKILVEKIGGNISAALHSDMLSIMLII